MLNECDTPTSRYDIFLDVVKINQLINSLAYEYTHETPQ